MLNPTAYSGASSPAAPPTVPAFAAVSPVSLSPNVPPNVPPNFPSNVAPSRPQPALEHRFGRAVRRLREQRGWSQEALAAEAVLNRSYLGEVERGVVSPSLATVAKLARALEVPLAELVAACEPTPPPAPV